MTTKSWLLGAVLALSACQAPPAEQGEAPTPDDLPPVTETAPPTLDFTVDAIIAEPGAAGTLAGALLEVGPLDADETEALAEALGRVGATEVAVAVREARRDQPGVSADEQRYPLLALALENGTLQDQVEAEFEAWSGSETAPTVEGLEAFFRVANAAGSRQVTEVALRGLALTLGNFRQGGPTEALAKEIRLLTLPDAATARAGVDYRFAPSWLELLVDLGDVAAIARVTAAYAEGRGAEVVASYQSLVDTYEGRAILDTQEAGCEVVIDGVPQVHGALELIPGSHAVGCTGEAPELLVIGPDERVTWSP